MAFQRSPALDTGTDMAAEGTFLGFGDLVDVLAVPGVVHLQHAAWRAAPFERTGTEHPDVGFLGRRSRDRFFLARRP